jgi:GT2 family glycosyltransferase
MRWSIIICTHNRAADLAENLPRLKLIDYPPGQYEIMVIDNASTDDTSAVAFSEGVACIREERLGLSHARNRGIAEACGELIAFIDDDAWPEPDWLKKLDEAFADPQVACVGGRVIPAWKELVGWPDWLHERLIGFFSVVDYGARQELHYPNYPVGTNIAVRKKVFDEIGGFNADLGRRGTSLLSGEESELCLRIEKAGYRILYIPETVVHHMIHARRLTKEWVKERSYWQGISSALLERKFSPKSRRALRLVIYALFVVTGTVARVVFICLRREKIAFFCQCQVVLCKAYLKKVLELL